MLLGENRVGKGGQFQVLTTRDGEPAKVQCAVYIAKEETYTRIVLCLQGQDSGLIEIHQSYRIMIKKGGEPGFESIVF